VEVWGVPVVELGSNIEYEMIWQIYQKEKQSNELQLIPKTLYEDVVILINELKKQKTEDTDLQVSNAQRLINSIFEKRKQKILLYVAYGKQMPGQSPRQDEELYNEVLAVLKSKQLSTAQVEEQKTLIAIQKIPEIMLPSGNKEGPFEKDQLVNVKSRSKEDINFLINNNICKEIT
jgi:DNA replication initiation complex subunit (GINS family)